MSGLHNSNKEAGTPPVVLWWSVAGPLARCDPTVKFPPPTLGVLVCFHPLRQGLIATKDRRSRRKKGRAAGSSG